MTKKELIAAIKIKNPDIEINESDSKNDLQEMYNQLYQGAEEPINSEVPEQTEQPEEIELDNITPEPEPPKVNSFDEMLNKISSAEAPPKTEKIEKPIAERTTRKRKKGSSDPESSRIEGFILLIAVDTVFPAALAFMNNMIDKKHEKIEIQQLQLDEKSFAKLEPLADQAADYLAFNVNPVAGFFIAASLMYANNLIQLKMTKV